MSLRLGVHMCALSLLPQCALHIKRSSPVLTPAAVCSSKYSLCSAGSQGKTRGQVTPSHRSVLHRNTHTHAHKTCTREEKTHTGDSIMYFIYTFSPDFDLSLTRKGTRESVFSIEGITGGSFRFEKVFGQQLVVQSHFKLFQGKLESFSGVLC